MDSTIRYRAKPSLLLTLRKRERSLSWLARKIKLSQAFLWYVARDERTIAGDKATLVAALLEESIDDLFTATSVPDITPDRAMEAA